MTQTAGKCKYIEGAFEETFASDTLNLTRWKESSVHGVRRDQNPTLPPTRRTRLKSHRLSHPRRSH